MKIYRFFIFSALLLFSIPTFAADIYVSPNGSDKNDGTINKPYKTIRIALRHARNLRRLEDKSVEGGVTIHLAPGTHYLYEPLYVRPEDSGTEDSPTIIKGENAVVSGGVVVSGWKKKGKFYVANTPAFNGNLIDFRQLYINGVKAVRARDVENFDDMAYSFAL